MRSSALSAEPAASPLKLARHAAGLSREELAVAAGVAAKTVYQAEVRRVTPHRATRAALARALGIDEHALFANPPAPDTPTPRSTT